MTVAIRAASLVLAASVAVPAFAGDVDLPRHPSLSPDGREVAFSWRGDLWKAPTAGGHAQRLTSHPADEGRSAWSPDGKRIAFESDRSGSENAWVMDADGSNVRQVTREDAPLSLAGWSHDGKELLVGAAREGDVYREARPYAVPAEGGGPFRRLHGAFGRDPVQSPDGTLLVFGRGGAVWTRRGYRGADNRNVWLHDPSTGTFAQLTKWEGNDGRAAWADARTLLYTSDRIDGTVNVFRMRLDPKRPADAERGVEAVTSFRGTDVRDLAVSRDGRTAVVHVWDRLHRIDLTKPGQPPVAIPLTAPDDAGSESVLEDVSDDVTEAALSPDGKVMAVVAYGDVFVRNVEEKHPTLRVTETAARERHVAWSPDGARLYFTSDRDSRESIWAATVTRTRTEIRADFEKATKPEAPAAPESKPAEAPPPESTPATEKPPAEKPKDAPAKPSPGDRWHDPVAFAVEAVVVSDRHDRDPRPSPDGKRLAFRRGAGDVFVLDLATKECKRLVAGWDPAVDFRWSPDSRWIAYVHDDRDFNSDVRIVPADGSAPPVNVTRHPAKDASPRWSADGKVLAFLSQRKDGEVDVWRVFLDRALETKTAAEIADYHQEAAAGAKKRKPLGSTEPTKDAKAPDPAKASPPGPDLDDAWRRLVRVTTLRGDESSLEIAPGGDTFFFRGKDGSTEGIFAVNWDGTNLRKLAGPGDVQHVSLGGETVVYVATGKAGTVPAAGGAAKSVDVSARVRVNLAAHAEQRFREAARIVGETFYHPTMKGLDWEAQTARYLALARRSRTAEEFDDVAACLLGELNGSHLGIRSKRRDPPPSEPNGRLGLDATAVAEDDGLAWRVDRVLAFGPAAKSPTPLREGDVLLSADGRPFRRDATLEASLAGRVGVETVIGVRRGADGAAKTFDALVTPIAAAADAELRYDAWTERNERLVHERSGKRLGYLHIRSMNRNSLEDFERDLYAAAEGHQGLVIDVRNNGGGHTADYVLASIMVQPHAYTVPRGADPEMKDGYPRDRLFIQRYVQPVNLVCNEKSYSNAEILSHAFRTLRRGTLVGQETHGGVISTGATTLPDGTVVRIPFRGWFLPDGTDMENHGARPDLLVPQTPEAEARGDDEQLRAAVDDLLKRLP